MRCSIWAYPLASALFLFGGSCGRSGLTGTQDAGAGVDAQPAPASPDAGVSMSPEERALAAFRDAGYRRGMNLCTCLLPAPLSPEKLAACAWDESGGAEMLSRPDGERCARELLHGNEILRTYLECEAKRYAAVTECEARACPNSPTCVDVDCPVLPRDLEERWLGCQTAFYCAAVRSDSARCNGLFECPDHSDERGCGQQFVCSDQVHLVSVYSVCDRYNDCPDGLDERYCLLNPMTKQFRCADGSSIDVGLVCDGRADCSDGRDEAMCGPP